MAETLRIVTNIGTPLALLGFALALGFYAYSRKLESQEKKLELLPPDERAKTVDSYLTRYKIDGGNLTREQKFQLIRNEMENRYRLSRIRWMIAAIAFVVCFLATVVAYGLRHSALPADTSLQLRMTQKGVMTATEQRLGSQFAFSLSNPNSGLAIIDSLELVVLDVIEDHWPVAEAQIANFKYELTLNPKQRGPVRFAGGFKYAPGEVDQFALNVYSAPEGYDYFVLIVVTWYDAASRVQRKTTSDVMVARFPKGAPWGDPAKAELHKQAIQKHRDLLQSKQGAD